MNDGRIMAADMQYYANAGNTVDESTLVCKSSYCIFIIKLCLCSSAVSYKRRH